MFYWIKLENAISIGFLVTNAVKYFIILFYVTTFNCHSISYLHLPLNHWLCPMMLHWEWNINLIKYLPRSLQLSWYGTYCTNKYSKYLKIQWDDVYRMIYTTQGLSSDNIGNLHPQGKISRIFVSPVFQCSAQMKVVDAMNHVDQKIWR